MGDFYEPPTWAYEIEKCEWLKWNG
jgi:hypothetical protein